MTDDRGLSRRTFIRGAGATAGVAAVGVGSSRLEAGPVQEAEAIPPLIIAGAAIGGSVALGWALREFEVVGKDDPPEGLTPDALHETAYNTIRARQSTNASTFVDNRNILDGVKHSAYAEGKIASIDSLNEQETKETVTGDGTDAVDDYETTIVRNFLRTWNESVAELESIYNSVDSHADLAVNDVLAVWGDTDAKEDHDYDINSLSFSTTAHTLPNGEEMDVNLVNLDAKWHGDPNSDATERSGDFTREMTPLESTSSKVYSLTTGDWYTDSMHFEAIHPDGGDPAIYLEDGDVWFDLFTEIGDLFDGVRDGLTLWVDGVYEDVQAGELDTEELLTPRELAEMTTDDEDYNQAVADLLALNVSVDLEREAEIRLPEIGATLYGSLAVTGDTTLEPGTIDPSADEFSYYFTYNVAEGEGTWDAYNAPVDGGVVTFTSEPFEGTTYFIETNAGESAEVSASAFTDNGDGTWTVDTVDRFQGSSKEVIVVSFVATQDLDSPIFEDYRRVNVALSRAKKSLVLVGDEETLRSDDRYARMVEWAS